MEKQAKSKNTLLKFLPKAASAVSFQNPPFSPNKEKLKAHIGKGFSAPITTSIIPAEARRRSKFSSFESCREPTSPKVSCIGQIKHKHKNKNQNPKKAVSLPKDLNFAPKSQKKKQSVIGNLFGRKSDVSANKSKVEDKTMQPNLSQMTRYASSRDRFANFDWTTAQIAPVDEERGEREGEGEEEEKVIIPYSAPMMINAGNGGMVLEPRKEVNLWKRRTMAQPRPLQLNPLVVSY